MRDVFVWIAIMVVVPLLVLQLIFGVKITAEDEGIPLLTLLLMNEFGAVLCAIAAGTSISVMKKSGVRASLVAGTVIVTVFVFVFLWRLFELYPTS